MILKTFNKKLGYYVCDGLEFHSKIVACLHGVKVDKPVKWIFNNEEFNAYDWTQEPEPTLDQLYDARARQLREDYDYIILSYSGGADSNNIYESFRRQGLLIDEIVVNSMTKASERFITVDPKNKHPFSGPQSEHELHLLPRLNQIQIEMPRTKISVFDLSDHMFSSLENADESWVLTMKEGLNPIGITRFNYLSFDHVKHLFDKGKKIALITGIEKLKTVIRGNRLYAKFTDRGANINTVAEHIKEYENCTVEYFYWSPECVPLMIKQGHVIRKWLEATPDHQEYWMDHHANMHTVRLKHEPILRNILYSTWNNHWWQSYKSVSDWYSEFDRWFIDNYKDTRAWYGWHAGIDYVKTNLKPFLKINQFGNVDGLQPISIHYDLGPIKLAPGKSTWLET